MSNKLILSVFVPATGDFNNATIINVEHETNKGYSVVVTEGNETHVRAFDSQFDAVTHATAYAALIVS